MEETLFDAKQELKRVDHLIYVSLKYTRTVDVLRNVIDRLVSAMDFMVLAVLEYARDKGRLDEIPTAPVARNEKLKEVFADDEKLVALAEFYALLRKILKLDYIRKENEYRRHVAMVFDVEGEEITINIDNVTEYYKDAKEYISYIESNCVI